ncbi:MAG: phosphoribosylglycinamide formyltransferase [Actinomycetales bacterium]|nr:phosphoribosylglycinamide formyltransferase [Actinomycetales bacterium]
MPARLVVLASGSGTLLQALIDAAHAGDLDAEITAVGSDVPDVTALARAEAAGIPTFVEAPASYASRAEWNSALTARVRSLAPDWVVSAGFMRILGAEFVDAFSGRIVNTHPALLPAFPGAHAVRDALAYGVRVTGCTVHLVDHGVDTGPILSQRAIDVRLGESEADLHERIKQIERPLLVETLSTLIGGNP